MFTMRILEIAALIGLFPLIRAEGTATRYVDASVISSGDGSAWESAFKTIQEGIDAAFDGDTVIVAQGVYVQNIHFDGKNITLRSTAPSDSGVVAATVIDGNQADSVVTLAGTEREECVIEGFTIRNGRSIVGGGLCCGTELQHSRATIRANRISGNIAVSEGSGVVGIGGGVVYCDGLIEGNVIIGNSAENNGGGLFNCNGTIRNNSIRGNSATEPLAGGGGLATCDGIIQNNIISENSAPGSQSRGGGLLTCRGVVENNLITGNTARDGGGVDYCPGTLQNNTICGNSAVGNGAGLNACRGVIRNCIIWGNTAGGEGDQIYNSNAPSFSCIQGWSSGGQGNIAARPQFVAEQSGDYHLQSGSPCIDAGIDFYWSVWPQRDLDRNCRLAGEREDIGCYEYGSSADSDGDLLADWEEIDQGSRVSDEDTDGDGLRDGLEVLRRKDPLTITSPGVIQVPFDIPLIQTALCLAVDGDEIRVAPGTYHEILQSCGTDVILRGWDAASTILVGDSHPVISMTGTEGETCEVSHFTIQGGVGMWGGGICGGTWDLHTRASIRNNIIVDNSANQSGGGIAFCDGLIEGNRISRNSSTYVGGGLYDCNGTIQNNTIASNSATGGGGLGACGGIIRNNEVCGNSAKLGGGLAGCEGTIMCNRIYGNSATGGDNEGGGLSGCDGLILNNEIRANSARYGGGLCYCHGVILNNTIHGNSASYGGGLYKCRATIRNCIIWENTGVGDQLYDTMVPVSHSCIQGWTESGPGNIVDNPLFVDSAAGNLRIQSGSPCIDAGANYFWLAWPQRDLDGNCRLAGERVDMGCYEYGATLDTDGDLLSDEDEATINTGPENGDSDGDGLRDGLEVLRGSNPLAATPPAVVHVPLEVPTIQAALATAVTGDEIIVSPGTYLENLCFAGADVILRSSAANNPDIVGSTILDGAKAGPVVLFSGGESEECVLAGFTIRNGYSYDGGGICGGGDARHTRASIEGNVIRSNTASYRGGGIAFCNGSLRDNRVTENSAHDGGGIANCNGMIERNMISLNSAREDGGGLSRCNGSICNNIIHGNGCFYSGGGLESCQALIENNRITENGAFETGGGLSRCAGTIRSNLVAGNSCGSRGHEGYGGGLYECDGMIANNTIVGNHAGGYRIVQVPEGEVWIYGSTGGIAGGVGIVQNCIIWGNTAETSPYQFSAPNPPLRCCIQDWTGGGEGNIALDPKFIDADGPDDDPQTYADNDYHLAAGSPCIDTGKNEDWMWRALDLDGNPRIWRGTLSWTVDRGAYEHGSFPFRITDVVRLTGSQLTWTSRPGDTYAVWSRGDLSSGDWDVEDTLPSQGESTSWTDPDTASTLKFYRIELK